MHDKPVFPIGKDQKKQLIINEFRLRRNSFYKKQTSMEKQFAARIAALNLQLDAVTVEQLLAYAKLLHQWNQMYNLTGAKTLEDIVLHHLVDSLSITSYIIGPNVLDVGTGAGLPGLPLALVLPNYHFVLLDSIKKKIRFVEHAVTTLGIKNIQVVCERVEKFSFTPGFATIVSRATMSLSELLDKTKHLYCKDGQLLSMKGKYPQEELQQIKKTVMVYKLEVPGLDAERHLVQIKKS